MQARLKVVQDNANLKQVKLLPITVIGRGADCHLKIASTQVSRKHCRLTVTDHEVLIEDLTSSNGTYVDQERIAPGTPIVVAPGAKLQIGPATFIVDYTPPVNLENAPTTVIKATAMPALNQPVTPKQGSEGSIPIIDPFAAAVAEGSAPAARITPYLPPDDPLPEPLGVPAGEPPACSQAAVAADDDETATVRQQVEIVPAAPVLEIMATDSSSDESQPVRSPVAQQSEQLTPAVVLPAPTIAPATASPAAQPEAATAGEFDFLGGAATAAVEPSAFEAFDFGLAVPATKENSTSPTVSGTKPVTVKKPLLGLFGKKKLPVQTAKSDAPPPVAIVPAPPVGEAVSETPSIQPPAGDDPFAFLR